jgi:transcriptional regulator with XRE-family HTH domain
MQTLSVQRFKDVEDHILNGRVVNHIVEHRVIETRNDDSLNNNRQVVEVHHHSVRSEISRDGDLKHVTVPVQSAALAGMPGQCVGGLEAEGLSNDDVGHLQILRSVFNTCIVYAMSRVKASNEERAFGRAVGHLIAASRRGKEMSGGELARASGVSVDAIRSIETGRVGSPGFFTLSRLTRELGLSLDALAQEADPRPAHYGAPTKLWKAKTPKPATPSPVSGDNPSKQNLPTPSS